jgi:acyl-coenzyme A synthetase/AMP-(fatty) acid ligase
VLVILPRIPEWYVSLLALMKLGAITIPCAILFTTSDLEYRLRASAAKAVITFGEVAARIDSVAATCPEFDIPIIVGGERSGWVSYEQAVKDAPEQFEPVRTRWDDPCLGFFTSGTTAAPKLVMHQHAWPLAHEGLARFVFDAGPTDLLWFPADNGWAGSSYMLFSPWLLGAAVLVQDGARDPACISTS